MKKHTLGTTTAIIIAIILAVIVATNNKSDDQVNNPANQDIAQDRIVVTDFDSCIAAGNPVMESFPEQCASGGVTYINQSQIDELPIEDPFADNPRLTAEEESEIIGMTESDAAAFADARNVPFRVVAADGEFFAVTMDYRPGRINATLENGSVISIDIE